MSNITHNNILINKILTPYKLNCHYLRQAVIENFETDNKKQKLIAKGDFSISESCYIESTGHFNAVEFNICYNELAYYLLAECINRKLLREFSAWDIATFSRYQLSNFFIVNLSCSFHKLINPKKFQGSIVLETVKVNSKKTVFLQTRCEFSDEHKGLANGRASLAITYPRPISTKQHK